MKKKSKKHLSPNYCSQEDVLKDQKGEDGVNSYLEFSTLSTSNELTDSVCVEEEEGEEVKHKKSKHKKSVYTVFNEKSLKDDRTEKPSKKRKRVTSVGEEEYKPGLLSDILQKKKYGCLILPWDPSFGKDQTSNKLNCYEDQNEHKPKIKINPLFDLSKRNEENNVPKNSANYSVIVGNLPQEITLSELKKIFNKCGNGVSKIKIRSKEEKRHKTFASSKINSDVNDQFKYALIKFKTSKSCEAALKMNGKLYKGHHLRIKTTESETATDPDKSIFVGNLAIGIQDDTLWKAFENCGEIDSVRVIQNTLTKKGHFGYVNFKFAESVDKAVKLDGTSILNREIRVSRIKCNVSSLSNSITVKRKKKKQLPKPHLNTNEGGMVLKRDCKSLEEKQEKNVKSSKNSVLINQKDSIESKMCKKKKKKKDKLADIEENKTSDID